MITNSKSEFFTQLEYELERIGINYTEDIKLDFEEHFAECKTEGISEAEAANRLGDVKEIARNYLNLESTRINSMVARDIERKVSLTKPGKDVPADLSLLKDKQSDIEHFIEYTPEHFSEEIYPNAKNQSDANSVSSGYSGTFAGSSAGTFAQGSADTSSKGSAVAKPSVSEAFSNAGSAIADAAKAAGSAIADAIENSQVKNAVKNAGQSVKQAGQNAASAVKNAAEKIPHPNDSFREHSNHERKGTIPNSQNQNSGKKGSAFTYVKDLKPNVNGGKLAGAIVLDVLVWSWLLPAIISAVISMICGGIGLFFETIFTAFFEYSNYAIVNLFLGIGECSLGLIISLLGMLLIKPVIKLVKFVIELHIKAIYDL